MKENHFSLCIFSFFKFPNICNNLILIYYHNIVFSDLNRLIIYDIFFNEVCQSR